jgi:HPt (histidine-containing phosphotransfer) domain-containing protein
MNSLAPSTPSAHAILSDGADTIDHGCTLDLVHLSRQTLGDRALETELLELFDSQAANALDRLQVDGPRDARLRADIAHMLKGSARGVGAFDVAIAADGLERALRTNGPTGEPLAALEQAVEAARRTVRALLAD